jgi:hypothetical protein
MEGEIMDKPNVMNAEYLRHQLKYEAANAYEIYDWDVHDFAMWVYNTRDIPENIQNKHPYTEGIVEEYIPDDEELMVQYALFKMCGGVR